MSSVDLSKLLTKKKKPTGQKEGGHCKTEEKAFPGQGPFAPSHLTDITPVVFFLLNKHVVGAHLETRVLYTLTF